MADPARDFEPDAGLRIALLAAGESKRLGQPKQLVPIHGKALIQHAVDQAAPLAGQVWVVLGPNGEPFWQALQQHSQLRRIAVTSASARLSTSLRAAAAEALHDAQCERLLVMLVDQYRVDTRWLSALVGMSRQHPDKIVASHYSGVRGVPVLFPRCAFERLQSMEGDQGARTLLRSAASDELVEFQSKVSPGDLDTAKDLQQLAAFAATP